MATKETPMLNFLNVGSPLRSASKRHVTSSDASEHRSTESSAADDYQQDWTEDRMNEQLARVRQLCHEHGERFVMGEVAAHYLKIVGDWKLTDQQAAGLIAVAPEEWTAIKSGSWVGTFSDEQVLRLGAVIRTYDALSACFSVEQAGAWVKTPHSSPRFEGKSPIHTMLEGGLQGLNRVRRYASALEVGM